MSAGAVFPALAARNLCREDVTLPNAFDGDRNVVVVAFRRDHQTAVDSWVPWLEERAANDTGFRYFEIPTIGRIWAPLRNFIDGGMAAAIRDPVVRRRTLTVYGDVERMTTPLGIDDRSTIWLFLVDRTGAIRWTGRGAFTPATAAALDAAG